MLARVVSSARRASTPANARLPIPPPLRSTKPGSPTATPTGSARSRPAATASPLVKLVAYSYLLDFDNSAANSTATYGGYATGTYTFDKEQKGTLSYRGEFAYYNGTDAPSAWDKQVFWAQVEFNY